MAKRFPTNTSPIPQTLFFKVLRQCCAWLSIRVKDTQQRVTMVYANLKNLWTNGISSIQKAYIFCLLMFYPLGWESLFIAVSIVVVAIDFWPKLVGLWDSHSGKLVIIIGYAIIMNFVLVNASSLVNDVSGISANYLPYTHNVAAILLMPEWLFSFSLFILIMIQIWLMLSVIYHLFKKDDYTTYDSHGRIVRLPFVTAVVKTVVVSFLSTQLMATPLNNRFSDTVASAASDNGNGDKLLLHKKLNLNQIDWGTENKLNDMRELQETLILAFMYHYETDTRSRCQLNDNERVVEINQREILVMKQLEHGYDITIAPCYSSVYPLRSD